MTARAWAGACILGVALSTGALACGCGGGQTAKFAQVKAGEMPSGETWVGVYYNQVYGYLHIIQQEGNIVGRFKRTDGSHWGELSGTAEGNVMHFTWKEHKYGGVGPSADSHGSGQFVYKLSADADKKAPPELDGQYALDDSNDIGDWHCVKQVNMKPDLDSINGKTNDNMGVTPDQWK
jgi:hypothetical protein